MKFVLNHPIGPEVVAHFFDIGSACVNGRMPDGFGMPVVM
jgi:hypothetical protein